jgi:glycosyltransferase involved in cell wall biosynthesis
MKILMLTPYAPYPPNSGARIRQWEQIRYLGVRHDLTLACFVFSNEEFAYREMLEKYCGQAVMVRHPFTAPLTRLQVSAKSPWPVMTFSIQEMRETLVKLSERNFDVVIIDFIFMAQYHDVFSCRRVLQEHNIESHLFRQYANLPDVSEKTIMGVRRDRAFWKATWMFMTAYENRLWGHFPLRFTVSIKDKEEMDSRCPSGRTVVIENGVNTREKTFLPIRNSGKILFMGTMNYYPNIDAVLYLTETIMPLVWEKDPSVRLCIAGLNPPKEIRDLASDPRIEIIGTPDDMREIAGQCCLTVVPLRLGGGTRIKILDAFAMGIPVISTSLGCEGLEVEDGKHIVIRDEPEAFAQSVLQVISDPLRAECLRTNGRKFTEDRYDWEKIFGRMEDELFNVTQTAKGLQGSPAEPKGC